MRHNIEPIVTSRQELIVPASCVKLELMVTFNEKEAFSERLNKALDDMDAPDKGNGRQVWLGKNLGVSQKGARKWLECESIPGMENLIKLAKFVNQPAEWLLTGRHSVPDPTSGKGTYKTLNENNGGYGSLSPEAQETKKLLQEIQGYTLTELKKIVKIKKAMDDD